MEKKSNITIKDKIFDIVTESPGLHISKIAELSDVSWELAYYYLSELKKDNLIKIFKEDGFSRCFANGKMGVRDREVISCLRRKMSLKIILYLLLRPHSSLKEISNHVKLADSTIIYHLERLAEKNVVDFNYNKSERTKKYFILNKDHINKLVIKYKPYSLIEEYKQDYIDLLGGEE